MPLNPDRCFNPIRLDRGAPRGLRARIVLLSTSVALVCGLFATAGAAVNASAGELPKSVDLDYQTIGVTENLPVFLQQLKDRVHHPMSWTSGSYPEFDAWRQVARHKVLSSFLNPPPAVPWNAVVLGEEDRGDYIARKLVFNVSGDSRVLAYMTIPKGKGPFPAVLLLHDHGGKYDIGKEKVIRPFGVAAEKLASADDWTSKSYGGRYLGDELAKRGYVTFATDALNWGDRGGGGYQAQQALASNLMHLGMSFAGVIAWDDLRTAEFFSEQPEVDPRRIATMGLSMGGFRTWQLAATSERIAAGVSICWMTVMKSLMTPRNNQVKGTSAYAFLHPGLLDDLDYPDIASIACPKPMLFYNGRHDRLFPQKGVDDSYAKLHAVWSSQGVNDRLMTQTWDVLHVFNIQMQEASFAWLDGMMTRLAADNRAVRAKPAAGARNR